MHAHWGLRHRRSAGLRLRARRIPLAVKRLSGAIAQAEAHGLLGEDILGSGFSFSISIVRGAGAFMCGEETAMIASIEGALGSPKPPYPAVAGL